MLPCTRPLFRLTRTTLTTTRLSPPAARSLQVPHLLPTPLLAQQQQQRFFRPSAPFRSDSIERRVKKIVVEQLGVSEAEVKNDASFVNDLGADSLDSVELIQALEDEFGLDIPNEESEKIQTVGQAIEYATDALKKTGRA